MNRDRICRQKEHTVKYKRGRRKFLKSPVGPGFPMISGIEKSMWKKANLPVFCIFRFANKRPLSTFCNDTERSLVMGGDLRCVLRRGVEYINCSFIHDYPEFLDICAVTLDVVYQGVRAEVVAAIHVGVVRVDFNGIRHYFDAPVGV